MANINKNDAVFKQKIYREIEAGRNLYGNTKDSKASASPKYRNETNNFFTLFEQDVNEFKTIKNQINKNPFQMKKKDLPKDQRSLEEPWRIKMAQEILEEKEIFEKNEILMQNIAKLKEMHLIEDKNQIRIKNFKPTGK